MNKRQLKSRIEDLDSSGEDRRPLFRFHDPETGEWVDADGRPIDDGRAPKLTMSYKDPLADSGGEEDA